MYILDEDPYQSAACLISKHIVDYLIVLEKSFSYYNCNSYNKCSKTIVSSIIYSEENYIWFSKFYESLLDIYKEFRKQYSRKVLEEFKSEYLYNTNIKFENKGLKLPCVLDFDYLQYKVFPNKKFINRANNTISKNRILYILNDYNTNLFPLGVPSWYTKIGEELYTSFNKIDRKNVKVVAVDGNYKYYISSISDKWEEIKNVPYEMKYFINSLFYN